jgi:hypothetical protein
MTWSPGSTGGQTRNKPQQQDEQDNAQATNKQKSTKTLPGSAPYGPQDQAGLKGNPGTTKGTEVFRQFEATDAQNAKDVLKNPAPAGPNAGKRTVDVKHGQGNPLRLPAETTPTDQDLYTVTETIDDKSSTWQKFSHSVRSTFTSSTSTAISGTTAAPHLLSGVDEKTIFINDQPTADDVAQGGVGDCYFLAGVIEIATKDAGKIKNTIQLAGTGVKTVFYYYDPAEAGPDKFKPVDVITDKKVLMEPDGHGGFRMAAAKARLAPKPSVSEWFAKKEGDVLKVYRKNVFQAALWVPFLEKAYAKFAQKHGQYGNFNNEKGNDLTDSKGKQRSGYDIIDGGHSQLVYGLFYGKGADTGAKRVYNSQASASLLDPANLDHIRLLLNFQGKGMKAGEKMMLTAGVEKEMLIHRIQSALTRSLALKETGKPKNAALKTALAATKTWTDSFVTAETAGDDAKQKTAIKGLVAAARILSDPANYPALHDPKAPKTYVNLNELLSTARHLGTDHGGGQKFIFTGHAYSIINVVFKDTADKVLDLNLAKLNQEAKRISRANSSVTIRNPHHTNSPNEHAKGVKGDTGEFTVTLDQFLRNFTHINKALIKT